MRVRIAPISILLALLWQLPPAGGRGHPEAFPAMNCLGGERR